MKYKVGDKVRIKSLDWYNENKDEYGYIDYGTYNFFPCMSKFCGKTFEIAEVYSNCYKVKELCAKTLDWTDEMIERLVEEEMKSENELLDEYEELTDRAFKGGYEKCKSDIKLNGFQLPEGYIFKDENGNVINTTKIVLEKKKKEYPKTYEECCEVLGYDDRETYCIFHTGADERLFEALYRLKVCRDAYWKIAGEEMGLGKPWEPDWNHNTEKYVIYPFQYLYSIDKENYRNTILAFPTREMRDAFYENFKSEIEFCKELL